MSTVGHGQDRDGSTTDHGCNRDKVLVIIRLTDYKSVITPLLASDFSFPTLVWCVAAAIVAQRPQSNVGIYFKDVAIGIPEEDRAMTKFMVGDRRDQFDALKSDIDKWHEVIEKAGIQKQQSGCVRQGSDRLGDRLK